MCAVFYLFITPLLPAFCEGQSDFVDLIPLLKILLAFVDADCFTSHITHVYIYKIMISIDI